MLDSALFNGNYPIFIPDFSEFLRYYHAPEKGAETGAEHTRTDYAETLLLQAFVGVWYALPPV